MELFGGQLRDPRTGKQGRVSTLWTMFEQDHQDCARVHDLDRTTTEVSSFSRESEVRKVHDVAGHLGISGWATEAPPIHGWGPVENLALPASGKRNGDSSCGE